MVLEAANRIATEFVITNSGPGVSPRVQEEFTTANQLRGHDTSDQRTADAAALFATIMDWLSRGVPFDTADARLREPDRAAALEALVDAGAFVPQDEAV
ncbi:MAG: hypothetical protein M3Y35_10485 [Actinomycetota bacterium]|nr:hypothetical protein [Actinomycetota bacterium]